MVENQSSKRHQHTSKYPSAVTHTNTPTHTYMSVLRVNHHVRVEVLFHVTHIPLCVVSSGIKCHKFKVTFIKKTIKGLSAC